MGGIDTCENYDSQATVKPWVVVNGGGGIVVNPCRGTHGKNQLLEG